jgi:hypothetical protein
MIKQKFDLLKGVDNVIKVSASTISKVLVANGPRKIFVNLELERQRINHFTKNKVFNLISGITARKKVSVVKFDKYALPITYNVPTRGLIINISHFGVDDILSSKPGPINLYALMVYGITFSELVSGKASVNERYSSVMADYLTSLLIRFFGKQYGLLGSFSSEIVKLKFLINCYVLGSFYGITGLKAWKRASAASSFSYKVIEDKLKRYDFTTINDFITSLSETGVMPNINRHLFAGKFLQMLGLNFMPALEDLSRFISILTASNIKGSNIVPTWISKYNERAYQSILEISKNIFKRG